MDITEKLQQLRIETWEIRSLLWQESFLTSRWWFIAVTIAVSYAVWWKLSDKRRIMEFLLFGSFIAVARVIFDDWGISSGRWTYFTDLIPTGYSLFLNDLTIVPLAFMLVYQYSYSYTWTKYLALSAIVQGAVAFAFLPLLIKLGILKLYNWHVAYSFLFMMITATVMRAIMLFGLTLQWNARLKYSGQISSELVPQPAMKPLEKDDDTNRNKNKE